MVCWSASVYVAAALRCTDGTNYTYYKRACCVDLPIQQGDVSLHIHSTQQNLLYNMIQYGDCATTYREVKHYAGVPCETMVPLQKFLAFALRKVCLLRTHRRQACLPWHLHVDNMPPRLHVSAMDLPTVLYIVHNNYRG